MKNSTHDTWSSRIQWETAPLKRDCCCVQVRKRDGLVTAANYQSGDGLLLDVGPAPGKAKSIKQLDGVTIAEKATPAQGYVKVQGNSRARKRPQGSFVARASDRSESFLNNMLRPQDIFSLSLSLTNHFFPCVIARLFKVQAARKYSLGRLSLLRGTTSEHASLSCTQTRQIVKTDDASNSSCANPNRFSRNRSYPVEGSTTSTWRSSTTQLQDRATMSSELHTSRVRSPTG